MTLAFRRWKRTTVKAGGTLITAVGVLVVRARDIALEACAVEKIVLLLVKTPSAEDPLRQVTEPLFELRVWRDPADATDSVHRHRCAVLSD